MNQMKFNTVKPGLHVSAAVTMHFDQQLLNVLEQCQHDILGNTLKCNRAKSTEKNVPYATFCDISNGSPRNTPFVSRFNSDQKNIY
jgi:hypothetical protein